MKDIRRPMPLGVMLVLLFLGAQHVLAQDAVAQTRACVARPADWFDDLPEANLSADSTQTKACINTPVNWPADLPGNVVDQNLTITNTTLPAGPTHIMACLTDVCVNLIGTVQGAVGAESDLHIEASAGRTITINILGDSRFVGSSTGEDLLVVFRGSGTIVFQFEVSNITFAFGKNGVNGGSAKAFIITNCPAADTDPIPTVIFQREPGFTCDDADDVGVVFEQGALLTFASAGADLTARTVQGCAALQFNPTNSGAGRFFIQIQDQGALIIAGNRVNQVYDPDPCVGAPVNFTLANFDLTQPVFQDFRLNVRQNTDCDEACGGNLMVLNSNVTMGELLIDPWCNLGTRTDPNFIGTYNGIRYGFIIGANGALDIGDNTSFDYVELGVMTCPDITFPVLSPLHSSLKKRNPAALTIDGSNDPDSLHANIYMGVTSALYFRSGVDVNGIVETPFGDPFEFTIDFSLRTPGAGNTVLSVEAPLDVFGSDVQNVDPLLYTPNSRIEILSFAVTLGADLFNCCNPGCFYRKSFAQNGNVPGNPYYRYNAANFLIHANVTLNDVTLAHTDENHAVYEKNDILSEPAYIGGDLVCSGDPVTTFPVASMSFINAALLVKTDIAFTGFDLLVPNANTGNVPCGSNTSRFIFYQNGIACDKGFGRNMILGTFQGSVSCDGCTVINANTQLDVMQMTDCLFDAANVQLLTLQVAQNAPCDTQQIFCCTGGNCALVPVCDGQNSIHSIFLGNQSNISIGTQTVNTLESCVVLPQLMVPLRRFTKAPTTLTTTPTLQICGDFFAFETHGGITCIPSDSPVTGTGGIFVDSNGVLTLCPNVRVFFGATVTKSDNGIVNLPPQQVVWAPGIGIADWNINLGDPNRQLTIASDECGAIILSVIVGENEYYSEYKFDWLTTTKVYGPFCPFKIGFFNPCGNCPVACENINFLPAILGTIEQLQITGSRLGDPTHLYIYGGVVREFIYINSGHSGEEPTSVIVLDNNGIIGLGSTHRNTQSLEGSITLGLNGVSIIANGDGKVILNEDVIIDGLCHILRGPNFSAGNILQITSDEPRTIRVMSTGTIDLSQFQEDEIVQLAGQVRLVLEPGARLVLGGSGFAQPCGACDLEPTMGGTLSLIDQASIILDPAAPLVFPLLFAPCGTDVVSFAPANEVRVKIFGKGVLEMAGASLFDVPRGAYLGIETLAPCTPCDDVQNTCTPRCEIPYTDVTIRLMESARFNIGTNDSEFGGAVQIGNTVPHTFPSDCGTQNASIVFTLDLAGENTRFSIGTQGFLGFGVGIPNKNDFIPNNWLVRNLFNVDAINLSLVNGTFAHERIYTGDSALASLLAFSNDAATDYTFTFTPAAVDPNNPEEPLSMIDMAPTTVLGGGNMILLTIPALSPISRNPTVLCVDGEMVPGALSVSLLTSSPVMDTPFAGSTAAELFEFLRIIPMPTIISPTGLTVPFAFGIGGTALSDVNNQIRIGYVDNCLIGRVDAWTITGDADYTTKQAHAIRVGALPIQISGTPPAVGACANPCALVCVTPGLPGGPRPIVGIYAHLDNIA